MCRSRSVNDDATSKINRSVILRRRREDEAVMHNHQYSRGSPLAALQRPLRARTRPDTPSAQDWREERALRRRANGRGHGAPWFPSARSSRAQGTRCGAPRIGRREPRPTVIGAPGRAGEGRPATAGRQRSTSAWTERCGHRARRALGALVVHRHDERARHQRESVPAAPIADGGSGPRRGARGPPPHQPAGFADGEGRRCSPRADGDGAPRARAQ